MEGIDPNRQYVPGTLEDQELRMMQQPAIPQDKNTLLEQLDLSELLQELECALRGREWDEKSKKFEDVGEELVNEKGFQRFKTMLRSLLNRNTILSNLEDEDIAPICREFGINVTWLIADKHEDFGISMSDRDTIVDNLTRALFVTLKRAMYGIERKTAREIQQVSEIRRFDDQQKPKRRLGF